MCRVHADTTIYMRDLSCTDFGICRGWSWNQRPPPLAPILKGDLILTEKLYANFMETE